MKWKKKQARISIIMIIMLMFQLFSVTVISQATGNINNSQNIENGTDIQTENKDTDTKEEQNEQQEGRTETRQGTKYVYDKLNRLIKVIYKDGTVITYIYDKNGNLLETKVSPGTITPTATVTVTPTVAPTITPKVTVTPVATGTITPKITVTPTPYKENTIEVYYGNENWDTAYIHYKVGNGEWTQVPGKQMSTCDVQKGYQWKYVIELGSATEATVCFNNRNGSWDSRNAQNYMVYEGRYGVKEGTVKKLETPVLTPTITEIPYKENTIEVFYGNKNWTKAYIHYKTGNGEWTTVPGKQMSTCNTQEGYQWKYVIELGEATEATICFNDGAGNWDSRNAQNYTVYEGRYGVKEGAVTKLEIPELTPVITQPPYTGNVVEVYYRNDGWSSAYIHYKAGDGEWTQVPGERMQETYEETGYRWKYLIYLGEAEEATVCFNNGNGSWTSVPGVKMSSSDRSGYQWKYTIDLGTEENAEVCFNDGNGNWDSKNATNYIMYQGIYGIKNETVYKLE